MKNIFSVTFLAALCSFSLLHAQEFTQDDPINPGQDNPSFQYSYASELEEHTKLLIELDSIRKNVDEKVGVTLEEATILRRMKAVTKTIPLEYNSQVKYFIDKYISENYKPYMNRLYSLSNHYFNVYDKIFTQAGIPEEVRYLSLVESSLNPHLVSSSGAVGPWQFMYATAKGYDLDMNSQIDERKDVYSSTYAVSKYMKESYDQFNDWLLALASYNCGRGCVQRAIKRSGLNNPTFWELSPYLPKETQNYIPKYVAMTYVLSNAEHYGIESISTELDYQSKLVMVERDIDLRHVAKAVDLELEQLKMYNPAFKHTIVKASMEKPRHLLLPMTPGVNDSLLYVALNTPSSFQINENPASLLSSNGLYRVGEGETLSDISEKFNVSVQDIKAWNKLNSTSQIIGRDLIVSKSVDASLAQNINKHKQTTRSKSQIAYYTVKRGDSLDRISRKFSGSTVSAIKRDNGLKSSLIKPGMKLKIKKG